MPTCWPSFKKVRTLWRARDERTSNEKPHRSGCPMAAHIFKRRSLSLNTCGLATSSTSKTRENSVAGPKK